MIWLGMDQTELKQLFDYDASGWLLWRANRRPTIKAGDKAGSIKVDGYVRIKINRKMHEAHRLIWTYHNGDIPEGYLIDHDDDNPTNNRIGNLKLATRSENTHKQKLRSDSSTGVKNVQLTAGGYKAKVKVTIGGKVITKAKVFKPRCQASLDSADKQAREWREQYHGDFAKHQ